MLDWEAEKRLVQHSDIYQKGHKLNRINDDYYRYDNAGRLLEKTEIQNGFRQRTTYYRWNASNQLVGITTNHGEVWYYKYDGLGRRIAKECPQRDLKIEFVWDGDQLAYTQTLKNDELQSRRHSVFNGWQLIAQQDWYSELEQHHNGNIIHQRAETSYAITQPNGKVLALFNPQGRKVWSEEPKSIWGLRLNALFSYAKPSPFNPQMLFAGQWLDEESGLAYNRFRYYDSESGCYISSDPIGLSGGSQPYRYTSNPLDFIDELGLELHHIIPQQIYKEFKNELKGLSNGVDKYIQNVSTKAKDITNIIDLDRPFHGNHPSYNNFVREQLTRLRDTNSFTLENIRDLQTDLKNKIMQAQKSGKNLNSYFDDLVKNGVKKCNL